MRKFEIHVHQTAQPVKFHRKDLSDTELIQLYRGILKPRMIEDKMLVLLRQGKVGKWFSGIGQEAISVGITMALDADEYIMPLHRNLGYSPRVAFLLASYSHNGKAKNPDSAKAVSAASILAPTNTPLWV